MRQGMGHDKKQRDKKQRAFKRGGIWVDPTCFPHFEKMK
jgi:hypothetical protein